MEINSDCPAEFGRLASIPRQRLFAGTTALESMPNLSAHCGGARLFVKRDDCTGLAFGGNKVRQLEFYFGDACANNADTILITGAVQSNFVRMVAAGASKLGLSCHIQLEDRVASKDRQYHSSGNIFLDKILGATLHSYPEGEDESGADDQLEAIASELRANGHKPYVIHLAPGHAPLGSLGYIVAAHELLTQILGATLHSVTQACKRARGRCNICCLRVWGNPFRTPVRTSRARFNHPGSGRLRAPRCRLAEGPNPGHLPANW